MSTQSTPTRRRALRRSIRFVDALATPHGVDRFVELAVPTWSSTEVRARVVAVRRASASSVTLSLRPNGNWTGFTAGQHTQLSVEIDGVRRTRCYSMANSAHRAGGLVELTVKAHPQGRVSGYLVAHARPGMVVGLSPAQGTFTLPEQRPDRALLVSGGSGITPVLSMLRTLCDEGHRGPMTFLHYATSEAEHPYREQLCRIAAAHPNLTVRTVYTDSPGTGDLDGLFCEGHLAAADPDWVRAEAFVCGPGPLMHAVRAVFADAGRARHYHDEAFTLALPPSRPGGGAVTFASTGVTVPDDGRTLLEQAEASGLSPAHGCRMGICHTCTRVLQCGAVRNVVTGEIVDSPGTEIRICVSAPDGDVSVDL
jgi:ferredoxin-NADP reductase